MKSPARISVLVALAVLVVLSSRATKEVSETERARADVSLENEALRLMIARLESLLSTRDDSDSILTGRTDSSDTDTGRPDEAGIAAIGAGGIPGAAVPSSPAPSAVTLIMEDPQIYAEYKRYIRTAYELDYGANLKWLDLTPEQFEKFMDVEAALAEMQNDLNAAIELHRLDPNSKEANKLWSDYNQARNTKKREVLGDLYDRYLDYYRTREVRWLPRELVYAGIFSGETIRAQEVEHVADILVANCRRTLASPAARSAAGMSIDVPAPGGFAYVSFLNWPAARAQLEGMLSPHQIETLELLINQELAEQKLRAHVRRLNAQFKGQKPPG